ncbi:MAG: hypothetical protein ACKOBW_09835 [Planctomycetota bacterium]
MRLGIAIASVDNMLEFVNGTVGQSVIWTAVLVILIVIGRFIVLRFRDRAVSTDEASSDLLSNFREWAQQGDINEAEYRTIKTMLGSRLQAESGDAVKSGRVEKETLKRDAVKSRLDNRGQG